MRNTIATAYTAVPIGVTVCIGHDRRNQRSRSRNPPGHLRRTIGHVPGITGHVGPEYSAGSCRRKVQIVDHGTGVAGLPLRHDLGCELAGNGVGGEDAGIDVK